MGRRWFQQVSAACTNYGRSRRLVRRHASNQNTVGRSFTIYGKPCVQILLNLVNETDAWTNNIYQIIEVVINVQILEAKVDDENQILVFDLINIL